MSFAGFVDHRLSTGEVTSFLGCLVLECVGVSTLAAATCRSTHLVSPRASTHFAATLTATFFVIRKTTHSCSTPIIGTALEKATLESSVYFPSCPPLRCCTITMFMSTRSRNYLFLCAKTGVLEGSSSSDRRGSVGAGNRIGGGLGYAGTTLRCEHTDDYLAHQNCSTVVHWFLVRLEMCHRMDWAALNSLTRSCGQLTFLFRENTFKVPDCFRSRFLLLAPLRHTVGCATLDDGHPVTNRRKHGCGFIRQPCSGQRRRGTSYTRYFAPGRAASVSGTRSSEASDPRQASKVVSSGSIALFLCGGHGGGNCDAVDEGCRRFYARRALGHFS